jgi:N-acetylglucosaminyl-diphospho-decaprenol L-rhamnosyltransferase
MNVSIVIPVLNQLHYTKECVAGLAASLAPGVAVVVVDNGSSDGTAEFLATQPQITVIRNPENRGCAAAWNQGVRATSSEWVLILNNDVLVTEGWLPALVGFAEAHNLGIASPAIREGEFNYALAAYARQFTTEMRKVARWGTANGVCFLVRRRVFEAVGLFDEQFRVGQFEDADFFLRARKAGFRLGTTGSAFIHHFGSVTQDALRSDDPRLPYEAENRAYFRRKWRLGWCRRRWRRLYAIVASARWRWLEHWRHGHSLCEKWLAGELRFY